jgi:hypothetical protein
LGDSLKNELVYNEMRGETLLNAMRYICLREIKMEPREVAELVLDRVVSYCAHNSGDSTLDCMEYHSPDQLSVFIDAYLNEEENKDLEKAIESSDTFWDEVKKEYEKLWNEWWIKDIAYHLDDELKTLYEAIAYNDCFSQIPVGLNASKLMKNY